MSGRIVHHFCHRFYRMDRSTVKPNGRAYFRCSVRQCKARFVHKYYFNCKRNTVLRKPQIWKFRMADSNWEYSPGPSRWLCFRIWSSSFAKGSGSSTRKSASSTQASGNSTKAWSVDQIDAEQKSRIPVRCIYTFGSWNCEYPFHISYAGREMKILSSVYHHPAMWQEGGCLGLHGSTVPTA